MSLDYFESQYSKNPDPWGFEHRWYERRKYGITLACLPERRYRSAFEPGCSIGVLSGELAERCERLVAWEPVQVAFDQAARRLAPLGGRVELEKRSIPDEWPEGRFDLVVLSEVLYYFDPFDAARVCDRVLGSLERGGTVVAVHWRGDTDYPLAADTAHRLLHDVPALQSVVHHDEPLFLLDVWRRAS